MTRNGADYWTHTAQSLRYYVTFQAKEEESGYQAIQILPRQHCWISGSIRKR